MGISSPGTPLFIAAIADFDQRLTQIAVAAVMTVPAVWIVEDSARRMPPAWLTRVQHRCVQCIQVSYCRSACGERCSGKQQHSPLSR